MNITCDSSDELKPSGFIGYMPIKGLVRIFLNCKSESQYEAVVDVDFAGGKAKFSGLDELSKIKKFNRFIGSLEERAREIQWSREKVFESSENLMELLSRIKNSRNFSE